MSPTNRQCRFRPLLAMLIPIAVVFSCTNANSTFAEAPQNELLRKSADRGIEYLKTRGQADDGSFSRESGSAVTSLCVAAILKHRPAAKNDPVVKQALLFIESNIRGDGGVYTEGSKHKNYETCIATAALVEANENGKYDSALAPP